MKYSERLNGYWEEGYHYYIEIRDDEMTVLNYMRKADLRTRISYDADLLESGERTVISFEDGVLSRDAKGEPFTMIRELSYENGELKLLYYYTIMGETLYTLKKTDHGPFDHIIIRDAEYRDLLQGEWVEWRADGDGSVLTITDDRLTWYGADDFKFHVVSYNYAPDSVMIVPADLTEDSFPGFCKISVLPDMLTTYMQVFDMSMPMTVFARRDMLDKIEIPAAAKVSPRNTMLPTSVDMGMDPEMKNLIGLSGMGMAPQPSGERKKPKFCPECGYSLGKDPRNFCPNCGNKL